MEKQKLDFLTAKARKLRDDAIEIIGHFGVGHIGGTMSVMDALTVIYYDKANVDPKNPKNKTATALLCPKDTQAPQCTPCLVISDFTRTSGNPL